MAFEVGRALVDVADAGGDVHADAVGQLGWGGGEHFMEGRMGLFVLAGVHEAHGGLIEREGLVASSHIGGRSSCECAG